MKRILTALFLASMFTFAALAAPTPLDVTDTVEQANDIAQLSSIIAEGTCGTNVTWTLDDMGTLTISGEGEMKNYTHYVGGTDTPWNRRSDVFKVIITDGVTSIGDNAFYLMPELSFVNIPESIKHIGTSAFESCKLLTSITIPESVTTIGSSAFRYCECLSKVNFYAKIRILPGGLFYDCKQLKSIVIPDGVMRIEGSAFYGCSSLTSVTIPNDVIRIEVDAFHNKNTNIIYKGTKEEWNNIYIGSITYGTITYLGSTVYVESVNLNKSTVNLALDETKTLEYTVLPQNASNKNVTWMSTDENVVKVSGGILTPVSEGTAVILITTEDGSKMDTCVVNVTKEPVTEPDTPDTPDNPDDDEAKINFTISDIFARPGDEVYATITVDNSEIINSIALFEIAWDDTYLEFIRFDEGDVIKDALFKQFDTTYNTLTVGYEESGIYTGALGQLVFKVKEGAPEGISEISAVAIVKNDDITITSKVTNATVEIVHQLLGDINLDKTVDINDANLLFQHTMLPNIYKIEYKGNIDFTKDNSLDIRDAILLFQYSMMPDMFPIG